MVGGALFETKALIAVLFAPLLGTPVGWAIVGVAMLSSLLLYAAMRGKGMQSLMNPEAHKFSVVRKHLDKIRVREDGEFDLALREKNQYSMSRAEVREHSIVSAEPSVS